MESGETHLEVGRGVVEDIRAANDGCLLSREVAVPGVVSIKGEEYCLGSLVMLAEV